MNAFGTFIASKILAPLVIFVAERILGWRMISPPLDIPKFVLITEPHTTNWDIMIMFYWACKQRRKVHYVIKKETQNWLLVGPFLKWTGAVFIDRSAPMATLKTILKEARAHDRFVLLIAPSGTRGYTDGWKPGFYYIAQKTNMPIVPSGPNYQTRQAIIGEPLYPSGDIKADIEKLRPFFDQMAGKNPEFAAPIRLIEDEKAATQM